MIRLTAMLCAAAIASMILPVNGAPTLPAHAPIVTSNTDSTVFGLPDGSRVTITSQGMGERTDASGLRSRPVMIVRPQMRTAFDGKPGPSDLAIAERIATARPGRFAPGE